MINVVATLDDVPRTEELAVVINCGTRHFTALALASALTHIACPILLVDCESQDGSIDHFRHLFADTNPPIYLLSLPLRIHGETLDLVFRNLNADYVWLVDSDIEIQSGEVVAAMRNGILATETTYCSSFVQKSEWMVRPWHNYPAHTYFYYERPWIPLALFKTSVCKALVVNDKVSFKAWRAYNEVSNRFIAKYLSGRFEIPLLRNIKYNPKKTPLIDVYDTGALLHQAAKQRGYRMHGADHPLWSQVFHFEGITRSRNSSVFYRLAHKLKWVAEKQYTAPAQAEEKAIQRLEKYLVSGTGTLKPTARS